MEAPRPPPAPVSPPSWRQHNDRPKHPTALLQFQSSTHPPVETWRPNGQQHQQRPDILHDSNGMGGIKYEKEQFDRGQLNGAPSTHAHPTMHSPPDSWKSDGRHRPNLSSNSASMGGIKYEKDQMDKANVNGVHSSSSLGSSAPLLSSPGGHYPGPPPPYTSSAPKVSPFGGQIPYTSSPSESRRESTEDRAQEHLPKLALPSISEALARLPATGPAPHRQSTAQASSSSHYTSNPHNHVNSPSEQQHHQRVDSQAAPERYRYGPSSASEVYHPGPPPRSYSPTHRHNSTDSSVAARQLAGSDDSRPHVPYQHRTSLSSQTISPVEAPGTQYMSPGTRPTYPAVARPPYYTSALPSPHASNPPLSARSTTGSFPPANAPSGHSSYAQPSTQPHAPQQATPQPPHGYSFPPPAISGLTYEQSLRQASSAQQQQQPPRSWAPNPDFEKVEQQRRAAAMSHAEHGGQGSNYAVTVKRHLDDFDVENNLNDLAERTGKILDFSRQYGVKAHQYPRSSFPVADLPKVEDCDRMIDEAIALRTALERLKRVVEQQQIAEQTEAQRGLMNNSAMLGQAYGPEADVANQGMDKTAIKNEAPAGGFAGGDSKKRKGRNAPPGRCHSCNRVETPEWRRGPDGARTLCNACGLHYAKLTRKMGKENKSTSDVPPEG